MKKIGRSGWIIIVIGIVAFAANIFTSIKFDNTKSSEPKQTMAQRTEDVDRIDNKKDSVTWDITTSLDKMTDALNVFATLKSNNYIEQDFPYQGETYATITIRRTKQYGYDVIIEVDKGQIDGSEYYGTDYVSARFDNGTAKKYFFNISADGSPEIVFLRNAKDFIGKCEKANDILIDIPLYKSGRPVFSFHVDKPLEFPK